MHAGETGQLNILIVDDDPVARRLLVDIVSRQEHQAVPAESAEEILKLLPYWTFQVAFLDHRLPGMDGLVLGEYLRRNNPDMTIALVTGEPGDQLERKSRELGLDFIAKPFRMQDIVAVIDAYKQAAASREESRQLQHDADFAPRFVDRSEDLAGAYDLSRVPERIEARLVETLKRALNNLRSPHRYSERDRVIALAGLLTAQVLGLTLPRIDDRTMTEEYDALMRARGRRVEFEAE